MTDKPMTSRRSFLKTGALVAAPLAVIAAPAAAALGGDGSKAQLARIEDERAIEALNRAFLRKLNTAGAGRTGEFFASGHAPELCEGLTSLMLDGAAEPTHFVLAEDGARATGHFACNAEIEHALEGEGTFLEMARLQGNSAVRLSEARTLVADYVKGTQGWVIERVRLA